MYVCVHGCLCVCMSVCACLCACVRAYVAAAFVSGYAFVFAASLCDRDRHIHMHVCQMHAHTVALPISPFLSTPLVSMYDETTGRCTFHPTHPRIPTLTQTHKLTQKQTQSHSQSQQDTRTFTHILSLALSLSPCRPHKHTPQY